jgi:hypothetical protein
MSGFRSADAALEGFRITRENPRAFGTWVALSVGVSVLVIAIDTVMPASIRHGLDMLNADQTLTARQFVDALILSAPVLILALAVMSIMAAAVYRLIFRHDDARFGYIRLGADELRLMAVTVIFIGIFIGLVVAASLVVGMIVALLSLVLPDAMTTLQWPALLATFGIVAFFLVRLSLAPVATFAERRLVVFESWTLTRGQFWPLLGAYALAVACIFVILMLATAVFTSVAAAIIVARGGQFSDVWSMLRPEDSSLRRYLNIGLIVSMLINSVFSALSNVVFAAPGAVAYMELHGAPPSRPLSVQPEAG